MKTILTAILLAAAAPVFADDAPTAARNMTYDVWAFKLADGRWVKQDDRSFKTSDPKQARDYYNAILRVPGWYATSNAPGCTTPAAPDMDRAAIDAQFIAGFVDNANFAFHGPLQYSSNANDPVNGFNTLHRPSVNDETPAYCGPYGCYLNGCYGRSGYYRH